MCGCALRRVVCVCLCLLPDEESRKRKEQDGWRGCLFIHYPAASAVSGGHGNTCPRPFSAVLLVVDSGAAKAVGSRSSAPPVSAPLFSLRLSRFFLCLRLKTGETFVLLDSCGRSWKLLFSFLHVWMMDLFTDTVNQEEGG